MVSLEQWLQSLGLSNTHKPGEFVETGVFRARPELLHQVCRWHPGVCLTASSSWWSSESLLCCCVVREPSEVSVDIQAHFRKRSPRYRASPDRMQAPRNHLILDWDCPWERNRKAQFSILAWIMVSHPKSRAEPPPTGAVGMQPVCPPG